MKHVDLSTESGDVVPQFLVDRLDPFRTAFTTRTWKKSLVLVMGVYCWHLAREPYRLVSGLQVTPGAMPSAPSTRFSIAPGGNRMSWRDNFYNFS